MTVLRFTIPGPTVSVNKLKGWDPRRQRAFKTHEAAEFADRLAAFGRRARKAAGFGTITRPDEVDVLITYFFPSRRPDGDGPTKMVLDSLQVNSRLFNRAGAGIVENDNQVRDHHVRKRLDREHPRIEVVVGPAGEVFTLSELLEQARS